MTRIHSAHDRFAYALVPKSRAALAPALSLGTHESWGPPSVQSPFARPLRRSVLPGRLRGRYPSVVARTGSCARPPSSVRLGSPRRQVFAGCCRPLLEDGPSRHYSCTPCVGAWTHTPPPPSGALAHFFPVGIGLAPRETRSADGNVPAMQLPQGAVFRGCSHSLRFRLLRSLGPQVAPTADGSTSARAAGPFTPRIPRAVTRPWCGIAT